MPCPRAARHPAHRGGDAGRWQAGRADRVCGYRRGHPGRAPGQDHGALLHHEGRREGDRAGSGDLPPSRSRTTTAHSKSPAKLARERPCASCCRSGMTPTWHYLSSASAEVIEPTEGMEWKMAATKRGRLLIVDDEVELNNALCETLADAGLRDGGSGERRGRTQGTRRSRTSICCFAT